MISETVNRFSVVVIFMSLSEKYQRRLMASYLRRKRWTSTEKLHKTQVTFPSASVPLEAEDIEDGQSVLRIPEPGFRSRV